MNFICLGGNMFQTKVAPLMGRTLIKKNWTVREQFNMYQDSRIIIQVIIIIILCTRANVSCVLMCSRANVLCVLTYSRAYVLTCLACLRAHVPTCLACSRAYVLTCLACSFFDVPCVVTCSRAITSNNNSSNDSFQWHVLLRFLVHFLFLFPMK